MQILFPKINQYFHFHLQDEVRFHLYINTAPCGDARIFSPHEPGNPAIVPTGNDVTTVDRHPNRKARGQLRTKIESGEGTIPVKSSDGIQTWDGVMQGARLLTMSCSGSLLPNSNKTTVYVPYILAYKSRNFRHNLPHFFFIRLICGSEKIQISSKKCFFS